MGMSAYPPAELASRGLNEIQIYGTEKIGTLQAMVGKESTTDEDREKHLWVLERLWKGKQGSTHVVVEQSAMEMGDEGKSVVQS